MEQLSHPLTLAILPSSWASSLSYLNTVDKIDWHSHFCYKIVISLDNPFDCTLGSTKFEGIYGFLLNRNVPNCSNSPNSTLLGTIIEPDSAWAIRIRALLAEEDSVDIERFLTKKQIGNILPLNYKDLSNDTLTTHLSSQLDIFFKCCDHAPIIDKRIQATLGYIDVNINKSISVSDLANLTKLSIGRTRHLFSEQMGISFSQYFLWRRIKLTMASAIMDKNNLKKACVRYGFTDQSHFNRSFSRIFGVTPKAIVRQSRVLV